MRGKGKMVIVNDINIEVSCGVKSALCKLYKKQML